MGKPIRDLKRIRRITQLQIKGDREALEIITEEYRKTHAETFDPPV